MASIQKRVSKQGNVSYRAQVRRKGHPPLTVTFDRKTDAQKWAADREADIRQGRHFKYASAKSHTLGEMVDRYIADILPRKPRSKLTQTGQLNWWKDELGDYALGDVTANLIALKRDKLLKAKKRGDGARSMSTVNRYVAALSHAFTIAIKEWGWLEVSPIATLSKLPEPQGRVRFLDDDERTRLLDACRESESPYLYPIVVLAISTGTRKANLQSLRWKNVDLKRGFFFLEDTKNKDRQGVPLRGRALEIVKRLYKDRDKKCPWLFPGRSGESHLDIRSAFETAVRRAEIEDFRFHDLRHCAGSYLAMNGATTREIAEVLAHRTLEMVKRYSHLTETHVAEVVERMNEKIFGDDKT
ncbi:MAG: tyrosine-type recombinase/integrase [Proteobacteria bacterium]|nr:tyrosine-type recombinase/integrase [Pseudomonadota bacterium]